jgi:hypothetical protein
MGLINAKNVYQEWLYKSVNHESVDSSGREELKGQSHEKVCEIITLNDRVGPNKVCRQLLKF